MDRYGISTCKVTISVRNGAFVLARTGLMPQVLRRSVPHREKRSPPFVLPATNGTKAVSPPTGKSARCPGPSSAAATTSDDPTGRHPRTVAPGDVPDRADQKRNLQLVKTP